MSFDDLETYPLPPDDRAADAATLDAFAAAVGGDLPEDYGSFLLTHGALGIRGGAVVGDGPWRVTVLYGLGGDSDYDVQRNQATYADRLPATAIPIGENANNGDQLVLMVAGDRHGAVGVFQHDGPEPDRREDAIVMVAPSFATFLSSLRRDREEPEVP